MASILTLTSPPSLSNNVTPPPGGLVSSNSFSYGMVGTDAPSFAAAAAAASDTPAAAATAVVSTTTTALGSRSRSASAAAATSSSSSALSCVMCLGGREKEHHRHISSAPPPAPSSGAREGKIHSRTPSGISTMGLGIRTPSRLALPGTPREVCILFCWLFLKETIMSETWYL
jgi:hypothetical protein